MAPCGFCWIWEKSLKGFEVPREKGWCTGVPLNIAAMPRRKGDLRGICSHVPKGEFGEDFTAVET